MSQKVSSRAERRFALREMTRLADRRAFLLSEATRMINDDAAPGRDSMIASYLQEMNEVDAQAARSPLMRAYSEADLVDKTAVFFTGNRRDILLVVVTAILAALVTWLAVTGQFVGMVSSIFGGVFGAVPAIAAEPSQILADKAVMGSLVAAISAVVVAIAFIVFSISWFFTQNAAKRKEARDFLTLIVTFFVGILTGWAL